MFFFMLHQVNKLLKIASNLSYIKQDLNKRNNKRTEKWWCNTTTNAPSGLSAVNSQCHVPMLLNHTDACTQAQCDAQKHTHAHPPSHTHSSALYLLRAVESTHVRCTRSHSHIFFFPEDQRKSWLQHFSPLQKSSQCQNDKWGIMRESVHTYIRLHKSFKSCGGFQSCFQAAVVTHNESTCKLRSTTVISSVKLVPT